MDKSTMFNKRNEITRFRVFSRVRPFIAEEMQYVQNGIFKSVVEMIDNRTILLDPETMNPTKNSFEFDRSLWSIPKTQPVQQIFKDTNREHHETQLDVYNLVAKGCVEDAFEGYNSCILTYGQTGSGKTHTMMGKYDPQVVCGGDGEEGVIPRVCCDLFEQLEGKRAAEDEKPENNRIAFTIELVFVEIYMEKVRDLLDPALERGKDIAGSEARIRENPISGPFLEGVKRYKVESWADCCKLLERGSRHRTTSATTVHNQSSRSHAIFQLTVVQQTTIPSKDRYAAPTTKTQAARINLVDLAGSERGGFQEYVKESAKINKSLLALRRVIDHLVERQDILMELQRAELEQQQNGSTVDPALVQAAKNPPAVPYRESVLTWLLSDSLGGNARTTMIATLSPLAKNFNDTLSTLQWSSKARKLVSIVHRNDPQTAMNNKTNELQSNLLIRQQNVNDLRSTLEAQKKETQSLRDQTDTITNTASKQWNEADKIRHIAAIIRFQAHVRAFLLRRRAERLGKDKMTAEGKLKDAIATREKEENALKLRTEDEKKRQQELADLRSGLVKTQQSIKEFKANRSAFEERRDRVAVDYEAARKDAAEGEAAYQAEIAQLTAANDSVRTSISKTEERKTNSENTVKALEAESLELHKIDYAAEQRQLDAQIARMKQQIEEARLANNDVKARHNVISDKFNKTFKKK